ncbi:ABC transporter substrate-binding protein [Pseudorhodoplanes sp.]|uniref:ABC transporter substrate-binding protein n=1 Tax=Pseudorhodoplanes sp. TaxID=1934341 RepID=UPI003D0C514B
MRNILLGVTLCLAPMALSVSAANAQTAVVRVMTTETNPDTKSALDAIAAEYQTKNPNVKIELQYVGFQDLNQKLMSSLAAGDPPQIFNVQSSYELFELAKKGIVRPVDDVIDRIGRSDYYERILGSNTLDGKVWAVPFSIGVNVLWYRKDLYDKYNLKEAATWDEYAHNVEVLSKAGAEKADARFYGTALSVGDNWLTNDNTQNWMWSNGATVFDAKGNPTLNKPAAVATFAYLGKLASFAPPGVNSYTNNEMMNAFATGAVAHTEYPFRLLSYLEKSAPELLKVAVPMQHPKGPGEEGHRATLLYVKSWAMAKSAKFTKEAADFLAFLEDAKRKATVMKTVPVHYWPPRKSIVSDPAFLDQPLLKTEAGKRSLQVLNSAMETGQFPISETGTPVMKLGPALQKRVLAKALEQIVVRKVDPAKAVEAAAQTLK